MAMYKPKATDVRKYKVAIQPVTILVSKMAGVCRKRFIGIHKQPTIMSHAMTVMLSGRTLAGRGSAVPICWRSCGDEVAPKAMGTLANCCFTRGRLKNASHQAPILTSTNESPPVNQRTPAITTGSAVWLVAEGMKNTNETSPVQAPVRISRTAKTMIEMRDHSFSRNRPMPVAMPQTAGRMYTRPAINIIDLKAIGEPGIWLALDVGTSNGTNIMMMPSRSMIADPSRDKIAIIVTPIERFMAN